MHEKIIKLPNGLDLSVQVTPEFLNIVKDHFSLQSILDVDDDYIRQFIYGSVNGALDKAEKELNSPYPK
tara:strand:+ start:126 stop:332 length:207 start_codon:yes stop_codon:yes gene_type:complete